MKLIRDGYGPDQIRVVDEITGVRRNWVLRRCDEVLRHDTLIPFECLTRVNLVDGETIRAFEEMECRKIYDGAASGSQKVLNTMSKGIKVEQIHETARLRREGATETYFL